MSLRLKPKFMDVYYHITVRTAQKKWWLGDARLKRAWETKLWQLSQAFYVTVLAQVILSNHVHLVVKVSCPEKDPEDLKRRWNHLESTLVSRRKWHDEWVDKTYNRFTDLSCFMRDLNQWTASWHNKFAIEGEVTTGHLWGRRFFSKIVGDDQYLLTAMSYVDLNPVRAGIVESAGDFEFSTAGMLKRDLSRGEVPHFPAVGFLRHVDPRDRAKAYLHWLDFLTLADEVKGYRRTLFGFAWAIEREGVDVEEIRLQIKNKEPSNWGDPVFAKDSFIKAILRREGFLPGSVHYGPIEQLEWGPELPSIPI